MKRGKDDEKITEPLFPRLHVNDTDKGGPRAPPRNKMALYEQLSIPSQRYSPGVLALNPSNTNSLVPPGSSTQGHGIERNLFIPAHAPPATPTRLADAFNGDQHNGANVSGPTGQQEQRNKGGDEDDFRVPVFVRFGINQHHNTIQNSVDREKVTHVNVTYPGSSMKLQNLSHKEPKQSSSSGLTRQEVRHQGNEKQKNCVLRKEHSARVKIDEPVKEISGSSRQQLGDGGKLNDDVAQWQQGARTGLQRVDSGPVDDGDSLRDVDKGIMPQLRSNSCSRDDPSSSPDEHDNDSGCTRNNARGSFQLVNGDKSDDVSETSMVDSISSLDISPDDVVGIIGQKHFWKARRAIINQQRVFAVQVFELHRLIKVQKLIAGSPHILLEDSAFLGVPSLKSSSAKKFTSEYVVKLPLQAVNCKDDSEKANDKMECSAENAVVKTSLPSARNGSQPSNYSNQQCLRNPLPAPVAPDAKVGPWSYHPSPGHQWLVPVMSPSEGLVYKPYPGPGFAGSVCGGCGPFGPTPMTGAFMAPAYGVPGPPHQGVAVLPGAPPVGHSYFPSYGMPIMSPSFSGSAVEQMNPFSTPGAHGHIANLSGGGAKQSSCNLSTQKTGTIPQVVKHQPSKDTQLQGSTASSPGERVQDGIGNIGEGRNALPLFPTAPDAVMQPIDTEQQTRVIKVVPHNPRSASESVARIFQSIQEERKHL